MFEDIKAAFNSALDAATRDAGSSTSLMRDAVIEVRSAIKYMEEALSRAEAKLVKETSNFEDAVRRGRLAAEIGDQETVRVAAEFAGRHSEKVDVLKRKVAAQKEELEIARREESAMTRQLQAARHGAGPGVGSGGGSKPSEDLLGAEMDRESKESFAARQLEELKKRMGK